MLSAALISGRYFNVVNISMPTTKMAIMPYMVGVPSAHSRGMEVALNP